MKYLYWSHSAEPTSTATYKRVELDYEAAAKEVGMIVRGVLRFGKPRRKHTEIDSKLEGHWAGRIIGAALGQGEGE